MNKQLRCYVNACAPAPSINGSVMNDCDEERCLLEARCQIDCLVYHVCAGAYAKLHLFIFHFILFRRSTYQCKSKIWTRELFT